MFDITVFEGARNTTPHSLQYSWCDLCSLFEEASREPWDRSAKLGRLAYIPGRLNGPRAAAHVEHLSFGSYDIDLPGNHPDYTSFDAMKSKLDAMGLAYILATSTKSLAGDHRYRLMLRFDQPVSASNHLAMWHHVNSRFGCIFDRSTHDPSRLSFFPAKWIGLPRDTKQAIIPDWPAEAAFQSFACERMGRPVQQPNFTTCSPGRVATTNPRRHRISPQRHSSIRPSPAGQALIQSCASVVPAKGTLGYRLATDPTNPLYCGRQPFGEVQGGRMFRFLCRVAARAFRQKLPIDADSLFDLATAVNDLNGGAYRPDLRREVERALAMQAEFIAGA